MLINIFNLTVLLTILFVNGYNADATTIEPTEEINPQCEPRTTDVPEKGASFVIYIDRTEEKYVLNRILYLMKGLSCEIPNSDLFTTVIVEQSSSEASYGDWITSEKVPDELFKKEIGEDPTDESRCIRFRRALSRMSEKLINKTNIQFIVPIIDLEPDCSILKEFQKKFSNDPNKDQIWFNGILINNDLTTGNQQSIRVHVPNIKEVNLKQKKFSSSSAISSVMSGGSTSEQISRMTTHIVNGRYPRDWEEGYIPIKRSFFDGNLVDNIIEPDNETFYEERSDGQEQVIERRTPLGKETVTREWYEANIPETSEAPNSIYQKINDDKLWLYIIFLIILIILFLLLICFCCCCNKKNKKEKKKGANKPLVHKRKPRRHLKSKSISGSGSKSAESEDEWAEIHPPVHQAINEEPAPVGNPQLNCDPVDISDYEPKKPSDEFSEKPRHGYQPSKPPTALRFE